MLPDMTELENPELNLKVSYRKLNLTSLTHAQKIFIVAEHSCYSGCKRNCMTKTF